MPSNTDGQHNRTQKLQHQDAAHHLHPFTDFQDYAAHPGRIISRAEGVYIEDSDGNRLLDGMSGLWCCNLGYSQPGIVEAVQRQLTTLPFYNNFFQCANEPAVALAARLAELAPSNFNRVFFTNSGSEANDTNLRLVRRYWDLLDRPKKRIVLSRTNAYHGSTIAAASLGGFDFVHQQFETLPYVHHIAQPYWFKDGGELSPDEFGVRAARDLERAIDELGEESIAAFIAEPIQGAGGVITPPDSYWPEIRRILAERDILFISDEVICGFGRLGHLFGSQRYGTQPDLITFAKAVTNGFQPLGGVLLGDRVAEVLTSGGGEFGHGFTYSGHPAACAAALATLDILARENTISRVAEDLGPYLQKRWQELANHPVVGEARGDGMVAALELVRDKTSRERLQEGGKAGTVCRQFCLDSGLVMRAVGDAMIIAPPLVCSHEEIDLLIERAHRALDLTAHHYGL
ncbi:MAG: aminotransferase class III-fold pyridoxal phosphate-dependent enzyme [Gammaproteobacteria bacterium]|nr:MAG: aminotransferase class III-fold pyridoxal phosphate-dependent enzyme [Gammaproteobacteria bacterium]